MSRRIVRKKLNTVAGAELDTYWDRVVKYIPSDIVAAWTVVTALINTDPTAPQNALLWIFFAIFILVTALWVWKQTSERNKPPAISQITVSSFSFIVWVFALGGPFATLEGFYRPLYGSLVLVVYSLIVGLIVPKE
ncbi:MAG: hypothetical protein QNJ41_26325 [Xenococcaceae cyanobacterium MO_188.B32]|nr:hypothetical protein [Xenococcaceae cyanobacterium MO_188.B32]